MAIFIENDEFCIEIDEFCVSNDESCINNDVFCINDDVFTTNGQDCIAAMETACGYTQKNGSGVCTACLESDWSAIT